MASPPSWPPARGLLAFTGVAAVVIAGLVVIVVVWSGATLGGDPSALAQVKLQPFAGTLAGAEAFGPNGQEIPVAVHDGRLTPLAPITPGRADLGPRSGFAARAGSAGRSGASGSSG